MTFQAARNLSECAQQSRRAPTRAPRIGLSTVPNVVLSRARHHSSKKAAAASDADGPSASPRNNMLALAAAALTALAEPALMSWEEAHARAAPLLAQMTMQEKAGLMLGIGWKDNELQKWWYVGNTPAVARLGVPTTRQQDAAGGFRTYWPPLVGTVTCWPSLLSMAATFDTAIVREFATALGAEFKAKGANTILGPSINVHRVARNGRNFEYLSGEDPYLVGESRLQPAQFSPQARLLLREALQPALTILVRCASCLGRDRGSPSSTCTACSPRA